MGVTAGCRASLGLISAAPSANARRPSVAHRARLFAAVVLVAAATLTTAATAAFADPMFAGSPVAISTPASSVGGEIDNFDCAFSGREGEVSIAADPRPGSRRLVASWLQRLAASETPPPLPGQDPVPVKLAAVVGYSDDGGQTWRRTGVPQMSYCTGGPGTPAAGVPPCSGFEDHPVQININPSVAIGRDGISYLASLGIYWITPPGHPEASLTMAQTQANTAGPDWSNGMDWSNASILACPDPQNDYPVADADPTFDGDAYIVWAAAERGSNVISRTTDGGTNWTPATPISPLGAHQLVVRKAPGSDPTCQAGTSCEMVYVLGVLGPTGTPSPTQIFTMRSTNGGLTWTEPRLVDEVPARTLPRAALDPNDDTIYIAWRDEGNVEVVHSEDDILPDGNIHWSDPVEVSNAADTNSVLPLPGPAIAINPSGTVGVVWYDTRDDPDPANPPSCSPRVEGAPGECPTELWFAHSDDGGTNWTEQFVADAGDPTGLAVFKQSDEPHRFGGYISLAPVSDGFGAAFVREQLSVPFNPTEILYSHIVHRAAGYARPKSATPNVIRLVPAYEECTTANASHGAPLSSPSCYPPTPSSDYLTVGTPDANGKPAASSGYIQLKEMGESPIDPDNGDQADVQITTSLTDIRNSSDLSDYTGELQAVLGLRITDRYNAPSLDYPATATDTPFSLSVPCSATAGAEGGLCNLITTADAVMSEVAREGQRANWELSEVKVYDGGSDGDADTTGDNTLFAVQGAFAP